MTDKKPKVVKINEEKLVDVINDIVEKTIAERNLVPAETLNEEPQPKKYVVTEAQLNALLEKGVKINKINKK